jgi:hypothetical protein
MAAFQDRIDARKKAFKKGVDADDMRRKREDDTLQLRKQKREEQMTKKRFMQDEQADAENAPPQDANTSNGAPAAAGSSVKELVQHLKSGAAGALPVLTEIRKQLAKWADPPVQEAIDAGVVPIAHHYLCGEDEKLQFEALWVLTNIASGTSEQTAVVANSGAVLQFRNMLSSPNMEIKEQALWALANIAGDSTTFRDGVLELNTLAPILEIIVQSEEAQKLHMLRNAVWALGNMCRGKPSPKLEQIQPALMYLGFLTYHTDREVLVDTLWALSYISDGGDDRIRAVIEGTRVEGRFPQGALPKVIEYLLSENPKILQPTVRLVGNIASGNDSVLTDTLLASGPCLANLTPLLYTSKTNIRKEAVWALSNITAGTPAQIAAVMEAGLFPRVIQLAGEGDAIVKKEALFALANAAYGSPEILEQLQQMGAIQVLVSQMDVIRDSGALCSILDALRCFLELGRSKAEAIGGSNATCAVIEEAGGLEKIEQLQDDENEDVYKKISKILTEFFECESDDVEVEQTAVGAGGFDFSVRGA